MVAEGTNITVTVSIGKDRISVPNVMGKTESEATSLIQAAGLVVGSVSNVFSTEYESGCVCYQSYSEGSYVDPGTGVDIRVSKGPEIYTYKCNTGIAAPTVEEAPDYVAGTAVTITLVTDSGQELLNTTTTEFPQAANYYGLTASGGTITMSYKVKGEGSTTTDENGNPVYTPGEEQTKTFTRRIEFVRE